jgi:uncharacterized Ntn-hydrolase superfamily protein
MTAISAGACIGGAWRTLSKVSEPEAAPDARAADDQFLDDYEARLAEQRLSALAAGRRKGGLAGAAMAGAMLAISDIIEGPPKEDAPVTVEASSDPHDLEKDGFGATVDGVDVESPPLERLDPVTNRKPHR